MAGLLVHVIRTGTANLASVVAALQRAGADVEVTERAEDVEGAERLVLPGVGTLTAAMGRLDENGMVEPLRKRIDAGRPTFAVCLGLQLLCQGSDESPGVPGLGVVPGQITRLPDHLIVPQTGWNLIEPRPGCRLLREGYVYYTNSYRLESPPRGWEVALTDYGGPFVAAMERGQVLACQFHPELSGRFGLELIRRWLEC